MLPEDFQSLRLKLASPEAILSWSHGEVTKPETINYRTQRPEKDGLFSERIFGPTKDWECYCGKYRRIRYKGVICDKCGVEVTRSIVRRDRMGHIKLACPVAHIWFLKSIPSRIGMFLGIPQQHLERVIYYTAYIVISVNEEAKKKALEDLEHEYKSKKKGEKKSVLNTVYQRRRDEIIGLKPLKILSEIEYLDLSRKYGHIFEAGIGSEPIRKLLEEIDLKKLKKELFKSLANASLIDKKKIIYRFKLAKSFIKNNLRPEWMFLTVLPVLPPDLRPMVALDGGRFATSDLNDLYRRVINRNNRLEKLMELNAPEVIIRNEKRMLQEAVDALLDNAARDSQMQMTAQRRPLKSLADILKGKQGRFRQNLLGKRVDYSGRSVIVVGPELHHNECGLPKRMALELFRPFVVNKLIERGIVHNIRGANKLIDQGPAEVWAILEEVIEGRLVLLNRAPTLHRLGIQAFQPKLIEDFAIRIPPLVCTAFNADFDGDQMAVHLPLTQEAQKEARELMLSSRNFLKPASGDPIIDPTKDIVLGCYYLTKLQENSKGEGKIFSSFSEASLAYDSGFIDLKAKIKVPNPRSSILKVEAGALKTENTPVNSLIETSVGRLIFNDIFDADFPFVNEVINKKFIQKLAEFIVNKVGLEKAVEIIDKIKALGFQYATRSGITWSMSDVRIPADKPKIIQKALAEVAKVDGQFNEGLLTNDERKSHVIQIWEQATSDISKIVSKALDTYGPVFTIIDSGSRGSLTQMNQMMGMKGLVQNPQGGIIELPVKSSYKEGLNVLEYFIASHGARKGSTDTALKTAGAGYLTRRLIDVSQDVLITEDDCGTKEGIVFNRKDGEDFGFSFSNRLFSRVPLEDIKIKGKTIVKAGEVIDRINSKLIEASDEVTSVTVRSPLTCKSVWGVCSKCYGYDLAYNQSVKIGTPVGIIAAQSIGEPGTQLTLRTFHSGGVAGLDITHGLPRIEELFEVRPPKNKAALAEVDGTVIGIDENEKEAVLTLKPDVELKKTTKKTKKFKKTKAEVLTYSMNKRAKVLVKVGDKVVAGTRLCEGPLELKELLKATNRRTVENYIMREIQKIYVSEGVNINNKHLELIVKQMFSRVKIKDQGEGDSLVGEVVSRSRFIEDNRKLKALGKKPAKAVQLLLGITRSALASDSFLSAASFQETTRILVSAATEGKVDPLRGLKENVIIGRLIPAGTGYHKKEDKKTEK